MFIYLEERIKPSFKNNRNIEMLGPASYAPPNFFIVAIITV